MPCLPIIVSCRYCSYALSSYHCKLQILQLCIVFQSSQVAHIASTSCLPILDADISAIIFLSLSLEISQLCVVIPASISDAISMHCLTTNIVTVADVHYLLSWQFIAAAIHCCCYYYWSSELKLP